MKIINLILILVISEFVFAQGFVVDHRHTDLGQIPDEYITAAKKNLKIRYFRRSHGSQLDLGGMTSLVRYSTTYQTKYAFSKEASAKSNDGVIYLSTQTSAEPWNSLDLKMLHGFLLPETILMTLQMQT